MIIESIIFNIAAFVLFIIIFFEIIKKNDTNYIYILLIQAIGIFISFMSLTFGTKLYICVKILLYLLSIIVPIGIIILEKKLMNFSEMIYIIKAYIYKNQNKKIEEKQAYLQMITKYPNSYYGHKLFAKYYEIQGDKGTALEEYYRALKIRPEDYDIFYKIAKLNRQLEYNEKAQECLREILNKKPEYKDASLLLGEMLYEDEKYKEAINIYMDALKYNPLEYELYYSLGMAYTKINDFQRAKGFYEQAASINSCLYNVKYSLAQIALLSNDFVEAEKYFLEAINGIDVEAKAYYYLARIALLKGEDTKAVNYINVAIEINSDIAKIIKENPIFMKIRDRVIIKITEEKKSNLTMMEKDSQEHLENTYELVGKLKYRKETKREKIEPIVEEDEKEKYIKQIMEREC
ncbi:MAG: tetratricopeptide repeat protein [Clostridia bacterium]|nr:tetratricopeptide repeat protein [Clostridia bacterium]